MAFEVCDVMIGFHMMLVVFKGLTCDGLKDTKIRNTVHIEREGEREKTLQYICVNSGKVDKCSFI